MSPNGTPVTLAAQIVQSCRMQKSGPPSHSRTVGASRPSLLPAAQGTPRRKVIRAAIPSRRQAPRLIKPSAGRLSGTPIRGLICDELLARGKVAETRHTAYGPSHRILSDLTGPNGKDATLVTCWLIEDRAGLDVPKLTTAWVQPHRDKETRS
jgi:hypothetical protein